MEQAGEEALETTAAFAQTDTCAGILSAIFTTILCCFKPVRNAWKDLSMRTKVQYEFQSRILSNLGQDFYGNWHHHWPL